MSGGYFLYNVAILIEAFPFPLSCFQLHIPRLEINLPDTIFLPVRFTVESDAVPPYWNGPREWPCLFQALFESSCWLIKWLLNI